MFRMPSEICRYEQDLKSRQTSISVDIMAPTEGRPKSRIGWLLRQLPETWPDLRIEVWYPYVRESTPLDAKAGARKTRGFALPSRRQA